ncbi:MAG: hypothetical protein LBP59_20270 [Planctomycetaceae bacterium]|jgi:hypothetical protein|nr:hypothetical protein [Planctomycetaceae bacterium]
MLKFSKSYGQVLFFMLSFLMVVNCYALTGTVTVKVSPGHQTVKTRVSGSAEVIGTNTAEYGITATCDPKPGPNEEVKAVEPSWSISSSVAFVPPQGVIPAPTNPGNPSVNISGSGGNWTAKVYTPNAGQWKITFTVKSVYKLKNSITDQYIYNADGSIKTQEFTGTGNCTFKATNADFQIKLVSSDDFPGHSKLIFGLGENGEIQAWSIDGTTQYTVDSSSATPSDVMTATGTAFQVLVKAGSVTIKVKAKNGSTDLGEETITASAIEPSGAYMIMDPNSKDYNHRKETFNLKYKCRYVLTPNNVSFANLKRAEWGEDDVTGISYYKGDADITKNYFAAIHGVGKKHEHGTFISILKCKDTYQKSGGPYINVSKGIDTTGTGTQNVFLQSGPYVGKMTLTLPVRYQITVNGQIAEKTIKASVVSTMEITNPGVNHVITVSKTGTSLSKEKDSDNKSITPVIPPILGQ